MDGNDSRRDNGYCQETCAFFQAHRISLDNFATVGILYNVRVDFQLIVALSVRISGILALRLFFTFSIHSSLGSTSQNIRNKKYWEYLTKYGNNLSLKSTSFIS